MAQPKDGVHGSISQKMVSMAQSKDGVHGSVKRWCPWLDQKDGNCRMLMAPTSHFEAGDTCTYCTSMYIYVLYMYMYKANTVQYVALHVTEVKW